MRKFPAKKGLMIKYRSKPLLVKTKKKNGFLILKKINSNKIKRFRNQVKMIRQPLAKKEKWQKNFKRRNKAQS